MILSRPAPRAPPRRRRQLGLSPSARPLRVPAAGHASQDPKGLLRNHAQRRLAGEAQAGQKPRSPVAKFRQFQAAPELANAALRTRSSRGSALSRNGDNRARGWIKQQFPGLTSLTAIEVKHVVQRTGNRVERSAQLDALTEEPVVLDKS